MKSKIINGLALVCALVASHAQVNSLDSLYKVARAEKNDTSRFSHYLKIANHYYQDAKFEELQDLLREKSAEVREYLRQDLNSTERSTGLRFLALYHHTRSSAYYRSSKMEQAWEQLDSSRVICLNLEAQRHLLKVYNLAGAICQFQSLNDSALYYYRQIHDLATELQDTSMMSTALYNQAGVYKRLQQYDKATELYLKVKELGLAANKQSDVGDSHKGLGDVYYYTSQYTKALEHYAKAIRIFERAEDWKAFDNALSNIAVVYKIQGEYKAALKNYRKVLARNKALKDKKGVANDYLSIGAVYSEMGAMDSSVYYYRKALKLHREINYKPGYAMAYANLGNRLVEMDSLNQAVEYLEKSVGYYRELNFDYELVMVLSLLANAQLETKAPARAEKSASEAYALSKKLDLTEGIHNSAEVYAAALKSQGDYENAYKYLYESKNLQAVGLYL